MISAHVITACVVNNKVCHIISQILFMLIIIIILKTGQYGYTGHVINLPQMNLLLSEKIVLINTLKSLYTDWICYYRG